MDINDTEQCEYVNVTQILSPKWNKSFNKPDPQWPFWP